MTALAHPLTASSSLMATLISHRAIPPSWSSPSRSGIFIYAGTDQQEGIDGRPEELNKLSRTCPVAKLKFVRGGNFSWRNLSEGKLTPTNYQVFNTRGVSFPVSHRSCPSGLGHTLIFDPHHCKVRELSMKECWKLQGGAP